MTRFGSTAKFILLDIIIVPGGHVPVAAVALAAHGGAGLAEVAVDDVGEVRRAVRAEVRAGRGVHGLLVHDAARVQAVDDARLKMVWLSFNKLSCLMSNNLSGLGKRGSPFLVYLSHSAVCPCQ